MNKKAQSLLVILAIAGIIIIIAIVGIAAYFSWYNGEISSGETLVGLAHSTTYSSVSTPEFTDTTLSPAITYAALAVLVVMIIVLVVFGLWYLRRNRDSA